MDSARAQLDEALHSAGLCSQDQVNRLVSETVLRNRPSTGGHSISSKGPAENGGPAREAQTLETKSAEVWGFLEDLRGVGSAEGDDVIGGSGRKGWKVHQNVDDFRVLYREGPEGAASHTICVEGILRNSDSASTWLAARTDSDGHQPTAPVFKTTQAQATSESDFQLPFSAAEMVLEEYADDALVKDVIVALMKVPPLKNGSHPSPSEKPVPALETIGGFVFKRMGPSQCCFRTVADCSLSVREGPQNFITALSRQLADLGAAVYREISSRAVKDSPETALRVTLKRGDTELGSVVITSYEKIKQGLGEKLQKPGVIDRDALGSWLKEAKLDGAGGPKVEFRPVEGCSTEELSKALLELEACGPNLDNVTTPGGVRLEVTIGGVTSSGDGQPQGATSSASHITIGDDSESDAEFLDSMDELRHEEDSENEASGRDRGLKKPEGLGAGFSGGKAGVEGPNGAHASQIGAARQERGASKAGVLGNAAATAGRAAVTVRGAANPKKMIGRKRPAEAIESIEAVLAKLDNAVRQELEPTTSEGQSPGFPSVKPSYAAGKKEKDRDVVLGLGPGIATGSSNRQGGAKPPRKDEGTTPYFDLQGGATVPGNSPPGMEGGPVERGAGGATSPVDEDSDDAPSLVGSEEESEDEAPLPRPNFNATTDPDVLRARILELEARVEQLEAKSRQSTEWAHEKVMQAARKGQKDSAELKVLRAEVEAAKQKLREGEEKERGQAKKLRDSEDMAKRTQDYAKGLEKKLFLMEKQLKEVRSELEASLLKESETGGREAKALKAEKALLKKAAAWEKQRKLMQEEVNSERARANALAAAAERAEETARQASVRARQQEGACRDAVERAAAEKRARELAEKEFKRKDAAAKRVSEAAVEKFREEIKRLEREVTRLKLAEDESTLSARFGVNMRHAQSLGFDAPPVYDVLTSPPRKGTNGAHSEAYEVLALREQNQRLRKEMAGLQNQHVRRERECVMCMSEEQSVVFLPCAHQVLCDGCNQEHLDKGHKDCPSCRTSIVQRIKVYGK